MLYHVFAAIFLATCALGRLVNDPQAIAELNSHPGITWTAGPNERFEGMTTEHMKSLLLPRNYSAMFAPLNAKLPIRTFPQGRELPVNFDCRQAWAGHIHGIPNQGGCGSCWCFSAVTVLSDRYAIVRGDVGMLSFQEVTSCDKTDGGCAGGWPINAFNFVIQNGGIHQDSCYPYTSGSDGQTRNCGDGNHCGGAAKYKPTSAYSLGKGDWNGMMVDMVKQGPVSVCFDVYDDFGNYKSGVYKHVSGKFDGGHCVRLLGWGVENGVNYWLVANSWGTGWGDQGLFKIERGINECQIENYATAVQII
jgi:cathepsin B